MDRVGLILHSVLLRVNFRFDYMALLTCSFSDPQEPLREVEKEAAGAQEQFPMAPVPSPHTFIRDVAAAGSAPGLMDFKHGTTTLGFKFKHGIIIAVDSI